MSEVKAPGVQGQIINGIASISSSEQFIEFKKICDEMYELHVRKNNDYGSGNIGDLGDKGIYVRIWDKVSRLKSLVWEDKIAQVKDETVDDTLYDLAVYSIIMLIYRRGKWGR